MKKPIKNIQRYLAYKDNTSYILQALASQILFHFRAWKLIFIVATHNIQICNIEGKSFYPLGLYYKHFNEKYMMDYKIY